MDDAQKLVEELKTEIIGLKIRVKRLEDFILSFPNADDYLGSGDPISLTDTGSDPLFEEAKKVVQEYDQVSASLLQRKLEIGYARAARLLDMLETAKVVGPGTGSEPRKVLPELEV